jgi:hypothetical protein
VAVAETIVFSLLPNSFYSLAIDFVIGKCSSKSPSFLMKRQLIMITVYANSLLAVLNSRVALGSNSRNVTGSTELSTSFHVAPHQDNIYLGQVGMLFTLLFIMLSYAGKTGSNTRKY